jgi:diaminopimelate epimerase
VKFEKWNALGNDYIVVEERDLPFPLTPSRIRRICAPHSGVGSDGILLLSETDERGVVAALRIFNPDGSEAELSGNGAREAVMYLRTRGWTDNDTFSIMTAAGEMRPRITGPTTCTMDMGRAKLTSKDYPG